MAGVQKYPGASTQHWYQGTYGGDTMETNTIVWHTTEGTSLPDYSGGAIAPNFTAVPDFTHQKIVWYQHFDFDISSRALVNLTGGVETNTLNVCQIEVTGTCDPGTHAKWTQAGYQHLYSAALPDWAIRDFAAFARWAHDSNGVPLTSSVTFKAYDGSYGANNGVRMSFSQWEGFKGHCGHEHVPENLHGDPGAFPMEVILTQAKQGSSPTPAPSPGGGAVKPKVSLSNVIAAAKADPRRPQGSGLHEADVKPVEKALNKLGYLSATYAFDGAFGTSTVAAYSEWQLHLYPGSSTRPGGPADGIPGADSLKKLASKSGVFVVVS